MTATPAETVWPVTTGGGTATAAEAVQSTVTCRGTAAKGGTP